MAWLHPPCDGDLISQIPLAGPLLPGETRKRPKPVPWVYPLAHEVSREAEGKVLGALIA